MTLDDPLRFFVPLSPLCLDSTIGAALLDVRVNALRILFSPDSLTINQYPA